MPSTIKLKRGSGAPTAGQLVEGEVALDLTNKRIYSEDSGGTVLEMGTNPTNLTTGGLTVSNGALSTAQIDITGYSPTTGVKQRLGGFADSLWLSTNYVYTGSHTNDSAAVGQSKVTLATGDVAIGTSAAGATQPVDRLLVANNGDISFYEDTGTTAKFFWDASAESLGIGTSSPVYQLDVVTGAGVNSYIGMAGNGNSVTADGLLIGQDSSGLSRIYQFGANPVTMWTNGAERMRINSSGNVGIGTSSALGKLTVAGTQTLGSSAANLAVISRNYAPSGSQGLVLTGSVNVAESTGAITYADTSSYGATIDIGGNAADDYGGNIALTAYGTGANGNRITFNTRSGIGTVSERMRIDSSGNLLVGTTSTAAFDGTSGIAIGGDKSAIAFNTTGHNQKLIYSSTNGLQFYDSSNNADVMTLDNSNNVLVGVTTTTDVPYGGFAVYPSGGQLYIATGHNTSAGSGAYFHACYYNGSLIGGITQSGTTGVALTSISDYRAKENITYIDDAVSKVMALKPCRFNFISEPETTIEGFIAHELQEVVPEAVHGTKDGMRTEEYEVSPAVLDDEGNVITEAVMGTREVPDYQGIDQSKLVPLLTKALQEALTEIESLKARVSALEA